jgi:telomere length regulation protein
MDSLGSDVLESDPGSQFWLNMIQAIKDSYAVERMSEQLLHQLATEQVGDVEAYWILWLLFHRVFKCQISVRLVNLDIELAFAAWFVVYLTKFSDIQQKSCLDIIRCLPNYS